MIEYLSQLLQEFVEFAGDKFSWRDAIDITLVTFAIYWLLLLIRGTRAVQILVGVIVLIALSLASQFFQFATTRWILDTFMGSAVLIIVVLFQHDIRRALARVGRFGLLGGGHEHEESAMVEEIIRAAQVLARRRTGALIVLERESLLSDQIDQGSQLDADLSSDLLVAIFQTQSPLHDGAVIVRDGRILSAGCILPLTLSQDLPEGVGTRHRAAVGVTEESDALVIVVSEETAGISVVLGGEMLRDLDAPHLRVMLQEILAGERKELPAVADDVRRPLGLVGSDDAARAGENRTDKDQQSGA